MLLLCMLTRPMRTIFPVIEYVLRDFEPNHRDKFVVNAHIASRSFALLCRAAKGRATTVLAKNNIRMNFSKRLNRRLNIVEELDFQSVQIRRVDGALTEIKLNAESLLQAIQQLRDSGQFEASPEQIENYQYHIDMITSQASHLR